MYMEGRKMLTSFARTQEEMVSPSVDILSADELLKIEDLHTYFHTEQGLVKAVNGVSFDLRQSRVLGVVGESGCGKSMTALSVMQLLPEPKGKIHAGKILYNRGEKGVIDLAKQDPRGPVMRDIRGNEIAMIFQEPMTSLNPVMTVGEQIMEVVELHRQVSRNEALQIAAYYGGLLDEILMRFTDIFMSFPYLIGVVVFVSIFGPGLNNVMIPLIALGWMPYARMIRGNILAIKQEEYVLAARAIGVSDFKIITRHILPNSIFPVLIQASMQIGSIVISVSALSFLGLGAPEGYADWGQMLSFARNWMLGEQGNVLKYWFTVVYPGLAMVLFVLSWNLIGDAFRDIMDPRIQA
jgi:ABC-type antimicrobial peptide transport system permease subunit